MSRCPALVSSRRPRGPMPAVDELGLELPRSARRGEQSMSDALAARGHGPAQGLPVGETVVQAVDGLSFTLGAGGSVGLVGESGLGQDHHRADARRPRAARRRLDRRRRQGAGPAGARAARPARLGPARSRSSSRTRTSRSTRGSRSATASTGCCGCTPQLDRAARRARVARAAGPGRPRPPGGARRCRASCPAASVNASRSLGRSPSSRGCSCSTRRCPLSTSPCRRRCSTCSTTSGARPGSAWSSSATTSPWSATSATTCW